MVKVQIVEKEGFTVAGKKTWISGRDNSQFAKFWAEAHGDGTVQRLKAAALPPGEGVTGGGMLGVSCTKEDPDNRTFFFFIAVESGGVPGFESHWVPKCRWAVFENEAVGGNMGEALFEAEHFAFTKWLPASGYRHAHAPELEVYSPFNEDTVAFWLPIEG